MALNGEGGKSGTGTGDFDEVEKVDHVMLCFKYKDNILSVSANTMDKIGCVKEMLSEVINKKSSKQHFYLTGKENEVQDDVVIANEPLLLKSSSMNTIMIKVLEE